MIILKAYKYELCPNKDQIVLFKKFSGCCKFVYNKALAYKIENYERDKDKAKEERVKTHFSALSKEVTAWIHTDEFSFLKEPPRDILTQKLMDLEKAYKNFFKKLAMYPKFKKKGQQESFRFPNPDTIKVDEENNLIAFSKIGCMKYRNSRPLQGEIRNATISCSAGRWFVSIQTREEVEDPVHESSEEVAVHMGIYKLATLSSDEHLPPINSFKKHKDKLAKLQRNMARKKKFSANWVKEKQKIQKIHRKISNIRRDYTHKATTHICDSAAKVYIEDLDIKKMSKSASGTIEEPGKDVKKKKNLNRCILDQGWFEFMRQIEYKSKWKGGEVISVPVPYTSQMCNVCCHVQEENRPTRLKFICQKCGHEDDADYNAAKNILKLGQDMAVAPLESSPSK